MIEAGSTSEGQPAGYYLRVILRRGWILVICVLLGLGAGYLYSKHQHKEFRATADAVVNMRDPITGRRLHPRSDGVHHDAGGACSEPQSRRSGGHVCDAALWGSQERPNSRDLSELYPETAPATPTQDEVKAWERRGRDLFPRGRRWTAKQVLANSTVTADSSTSLIQFAVTAPTRTLAQWLTNGYAEAFAETSMNQGIEGLRAQQAPLRTDQASVQNRINAAERDRRPRDTDAADGRVEGAHGHQRPSCATSRMRSTRRPARARSAPPRRRRRRRRR